MERIKGKTKKNRGVFSLIAFFILLGCFSPVFASVDDGTINSIYKYAWSSNIGWINFGASRGNVHITDSAVTGNAWNDIYGWINLSPSRSGITNDGQGALSGYAWNENAGWINFTGVAIDCLGKFAGSATGDIVGTINFDCPNCRVITDWRPQRCKTGGGPGGGCGNGSCSDGENCASCPADCGACLPICGDGTCNGDEACSNCPVDCGHCLPICGNGSCEPPENCLLCSSDCGTCIPLPSCGDGACNNDESCVNCPTDCGVCPPACGDGFCNGTETCGSCPSDCGICPPLCGDGTCNGDENCNNCPLDCGSCLAVCGDGICNGDETCNSCPADCGSCIPIPVVCGNGSCEPSEDCSSCSSDCGVCGITIFFIPPGIEKVIKTGIQEIEKIFEMPAKQIKKIIETPAGSIVTKVVSTAGAAVGIALSTATIFLSPPSIIEISFIPARIISLLLTAFGLKKKTLPWGVVYDSVTKLPLDPAYVALKDLQGKDISSAITDLDGRYGFLVGGGAYQATAKKTNYIFPSQKLSGKSKDEIYNDLYFGEEIQIKGKGETIIKNIPLDPLKFDWNEFTKKKKGLMKFYSRFDMIIRGISDSLFIVGFIIAIIALFAAPYPYNIIIMALYLILILLRALGVKPRSYGFITNRETKIPLSFALIRVLTPDSNIEIAHKVADKYGRYYCLVPKGRYYMKIENKNDDGSYSLAHTSPVIDASRKGLINKKFEI